LIGGVSASATDKARAEAFLAFLKKPLAAAVIRRKGLEPSRSSPDTPYQI
jgi:ABC-type molybdate transport system substrate-binding protein